MRATSTRREPAGAATGYRLDDQIGFLLRRAYQRASANLVERIGAEDLTAPQFAVLVRLHEFGGVSQNELGRLVVMEPANVRDVVQRLKRRGLVRTAPVDGDRRRVLIRLSHRGTRLVEGLIPVELECTERTLSQLSEPERQRLLKLLRKLLDG
jgi:DNA-binding MarR family transcriptional regulator